MKVAILETLKEAGIVGPEADQKLIDSTKVGVLESLTESGLMKKEDGKSATSVKTPSESISFKDLPPVGKIQLAEQAGIKLRMQDVPLEVSTPSVAQK